VFKFGVVCWFIIYLFLQIFPKLVVVYLCAHTKFCTSNTNTFCPRNTTYVTSSHCRWGAGWLVHLSLPHLLQRHWLSASLPCTLKVAQWPRFRWCFELWSCSVNSTFLWVSCLFLLRMWYTLAASAVRHRQSIFSRCC